MHARPFVLCQARHSEHTLPFVHGSVRHFECLFTEQEMIHRCENSKEQEQFEKWLAKNGLQQAEDRTNVGQTRCENLGWLPPQLKTAGTPPSPKTPGRPSRRKLLFLHCLTLQLLRAPFLD